MKNITIDRFGNKIEYEINVLLDQFGKRIICEHDKHKFVSVITDTSKGSMGGIGFYICEKCNTTLK